MVGFICKGSDDIFDKIMEDKMLFILVVIFENFVIVGEICFVRLLMVVVVILVLVLVIRDKFCGFLYDVWVFF